MFSEPRTAHFNQRPEAGLLSSACTGYLPCLSLIERQQNVERGLPRRTSKLTRPSLTERTRALCASDRVFFVQPVPNPLQRERKVPNRNPFVAVCARHNEKRAARKHASMQARKKASKVKKNATFPHASCAIFSHRPGRRSP